jgi:hypothetical protein
MGMDETSLEDEIGCAAGAIFTKIDFFWKADENENQM